MSAARQSRRTRRIGRQRSRAAFLGQPPAKLPSPWPPVAAAAQPVVCGLLTSPQSKKEHLLRLLFRFERSICISPSLIDLSAGFKFGNINSREQISRLLSRESSSGGGGGRGGDALFVSKQVDRLTGFAEKRTPGEEEEEEDLNPDISPDGRLYCTQSARCKRPRIFFREASRSSLCV